MCTQNIVNKWHVILVWGRESRRKGGLGGGRRFKGKKEIGSGGRAIERLKLWMSPESSNGAVNNAYTQGCVYTLHTMHRTHMYVHKIFKTYDTSHSSRKGGEGKGLEGFQEGRRFQGGEERSEKGRCENNFRLPLWFRTLSSTRFQRFKIIKIAYRNRTSRMHHKIFQFTVTHLHCNKLHLRQKMSMNRKIVVAITTKPT